MASNISNLSALLLNPYAQNTAQAAQLRGQIAPIKPGATVTARYSVQADGELALRDVNVVNETAEQSAILPREQSAEQSNARARRNYSFSDISKPKATLSPTDELALFGQSAAASSPLLLGAPDANPRAEAYIPDVEFQQITQPGGDVVSLATQKQRNVADLYARNADVIYNVDPLFSQAA